MNTRQSADHLGCPASRIRNAIRRGWLPATKEGRDWFIEPEDLDEARKPHRFAWHVVGSQSQCYRGIEWEGETTLLPNVIERVRRDLRVTYHREHHFETIAAAAQFAEMVNQNQLISETEAVELEQQLISLID